MTTIFLVTAVIALNKVMIGQSFASPQTTASPATFAEALGQLKERGCLVLVVGAVGDDAKYVGCRRLLGDELSRPRRRLFLTTDSDIDKHPGAKATCGHGDPDDSRAITYRTAARTATSLESDQSMRVQTDVVDDGIDTLTEVTSSAIADLETRAGGFDAGELRVCIDDLETIIANDDDVEVVEFISTLRDRVLESNGLAHAHITRTAPGIPVDAILPYFDAILEVDSRDECRQRWHVRDAGITTEWLEL